MTVFVYKGRGVGPLSFRDSIMTLRHCLPAGYKVSTITTDEVIAGDALATASLFVLPGGRDVPYHEDLSGQGNVNLRRFVEAGGGFLGICAGAYYGASKIVFERGHPLEVTGERELGFFPGIAEGTLYNQGSFRFDTEECAYPALLRYGDVDLHVYYNGGCYFVDADGIAPHVEVLGCYQDAAEYPLAAIVRCQIGQGSVILSGVHLDYRPESIKGFVPSTMHALMESSNQRRQEVFRSLLAQLL